MKISNPFKGLTKFEWLLWLGSLVVIAASFIISGGGDWLTLIASLLGATALIFVAKGYVIGQVMTVVFAVFYGIISFFFQYYGEMITYLLMTSPIAIATAVNWYKHPYKDTNEVEVSSITKKQATVMAGFTVLVTVAFYFILGALGTVNLAVSTVSVTTSFLAVYLTYLRSPFYAVAYAANDIVLIVLWVLASIESASYIPMVVCFVIFLVNDIYGFINWSRMKARQNFS